MTEHYYYRLATLTAKLQPTPHQFRSDPLALVLRNHGHWGQRDGMKDSLFSFDEKVVEQDVPYYLIVFDGDQRQDHGSVTPQIINKLCFGFSPERRAVQLSHSIVVAGIFVTDQEHRVRLILADNGYMATATTPNRQTLIRQGQRLEYFTVAWNSMEALVSIVAGILAGSVSLVGFGLDSIVEVASGAALLWRLHHDLNRSRREQVERTTLRIVGSCFLALALYILYESAATLIGHRAPERSLPGIIVAAAAVIVMPLLARAKRKVAVGIGSGAMTADSKQADFCTNLSAILLGGLLLNALFGWWWADPMAGLVMVPIIAKEGIDGIRGRTCCNDCGL